MAELRRVGGEMESYRRPSGRRVLLPAEVELCEAVGLTEEDYWYFVDLAEQYNGERSEAYADIPDIKNDITTVLINLAISLVLTGVSYLLTPKPRAPEQKDPRRLQLGGQTGPTRFSPTSGFDATPELGVLGQTVPLVFTKKGVRVNSSLLWSQIIAEANGQQLRALFLFSHGPTGAVPDYEGLAIGDTLLRSYTSSKVAAYWKQNGGRPIEPNDRISGSGARLIPNADAFATYYDLEGGYRPHFVGARTPSTQTVFGAYSPMFNGTRYTPEYELLLTPKSADSDLKDDIQRRKNLVLKSNFSQGTFFDVVRNPGIPGGISGHGSDPNTCGAVTPGANGQAYDQIRYRITTRIEDPNPHEFRPHSLEFVNSATTASRIAADSNISLGELYLVGDRALGVCTEVLSSDPSDAFAPWSPSPAPVDKNYWFTITEPGCVQCLDVNTAINNPLKVWKSLPLQRAAVATVSNTRKCTATEIVIKSNVWRQVGGFPDMNAHPSEDTVKKYEKENGSIQLGTMNKYLRRLSFFSLEYREVGQGNPWIDLTGTKYFFVEGNQPVDQYNYIRVNHDYGEHEFRFRPVAGVGILRTFNANSQAVHRRLRYGVETAFNAQGLIVVFSGEEVVINEDYVTNKEFIRPESTAEIEGALDNLSITPTQTGDFVAETSETITSTTLGDWQAPLESNKRYNRTWGSRNFLRKRINTFTGNTIYQYWWDDRIVASGTLATMATEPPEVIVGNVKFYWEVESPDDNRSIVGQDLNAFRTITASLRAQNTTTTVVTNGSKGVEAHVTDAVPVENAQGRLPSGTGLKFFVEKWVSTPNGEVGYKWYIDANNQGRDYKQNDQVKVVWNDGSEIATVTITGTTTTTQETQSEKNYARFDAILDVLSYESQNASNMDGPEHEVVAVNEKIKQGEPLYSNLTIGGLRIDASTEWSSFSSFSAFMKEGILLDNLAASSPTYQPSNLLPDIVFGLMTNQTWGAGEFLGAQQVDRAAMVIASKFCQANGFTWDGVIDDKINFRSWVFENAQYCLLDATVVGGRFALKPAVPYASDYKIRPVLDSSQTGLAPEIKALFTDGNVRNMKVTFLSPQDRRLFRAVVNWREDVVNGFPITKQFTVQYNSSQGGSIYDSEERFDLSGFCTTQEHALTYAKYALGVRKHVDHVINFETTPQAAMGLSAGDYFRFASNSTHTSRFNNGSINSDGFVTSVDTLADGSHSIYYWKLNTQSVQEATIQVVDGKVTDPVFYGTVFTVVQSSNVIRVYKLEALTYAEDGLVEVTASHMLLTEAGNLAILEWDDDYFDYSGLDTGSVSI